MPPRPPPPPPPPELGQALLQMTQLLGQMQQSQQQFEQGRQNGNAGGNARVTIRDFLQLNPRSFDSTAEPLEADDWLREVNRILTIAKVAHEDKLQFATHLLRGESASWWENFLEMRAPDSPITWQEFQVAFRSYHIPEGVMDRMKEMFVSLVQGTKTVLGYSKEFTKLARYGGDEVSTDEKKQKRFRNGLKPALKYALTHVHTKTFEKLVSAAIQEETGRHAFEDSRKHAREFDAPSASTTGQKRRVWIPNHAPPRGAFVPRPAGYAPRPPTP